jgi:thiamine-monophosphate kinase
MKNKNVTSIGENGLIDIIKNQFADSRNNKNIIAEIGDDCFCFRSGRYIICITKDMLIEDIHFKKDWITAYELGEKAIEVNVSDIAAMGNVTPEYVFIGLGIPATTSEIFIRNLLNGFKKACDRYKIVIAGGDTVNADKITISVTVVGASKYNKIIKRSGANIGDVIGVTNTFGDAGAGIALLYKYGATHIYTREECFLISKQNSPKARLNESNKISKYLTSLTDASDGLYTSINLLMKNSNKGADIYMDQIPVSDALKKVFKKKWKQLEFALFGAEDYELVFTVPETKANLIKKLVPQISYIGKINPSTKIRYFHNGKEQKIKFSGFKHF